MTIDLLLKSAKSSYKGEKANFVCETLLACFLKKERIFLHTHSDKKIQDILDELAHNSKINSQNANIHFYFDSPNTLKSKLLESISYLNDGYPLEYITKKVSFYAQDFFIDEGALIPRPETEILVDKVTQLILQHNIQKIYEIGVGSGIISIMLCLLNKNISIIATDISPTALKIAQQNITLKSTLDSTLKSRIRLIQADLLNGVDFIKDSLIVSNPPYIAEGYVIPKNVSFEPKIALFGGKKGDEMLQAIIALDSDFLCCEIGYNQGYLANSLMQYKNVEFYKDYAGFTRGFIASKF